MRSGLQSPFLAHIDFGDQDPNSFVKAVELFLNGDSWRFLKFQKLFPRFSVWALCRPLSEAYGGRNSTFGSGSVWPRIGSPYGINIDDVNLRKLICNNFRKIADKHHLCYGNSGLHRDVDDLLTQAGVAIGQLVPVARTFLAAERIIGLPDIETTESINKWEDDSAHFLTNNPVAERVLLADYTAYYARVFIACRKGEKYKSPFEEAFYKVINERVGDKTVNECLDYSPQLIWGGAGLAMKMPERAGPYLLRYKNPQNQIIGPIRCRRSQEWMLPLPWPDRIDCIHEDMDQSIKVREQNRELLIFSSETKFLTNRLTENQTGTIWTADSDITIISESPFRIEGFSVIKSGALFICYLKLEREGIKITGRNGFVWDIRSRPRLRCKFKNTTPLRSEGKRLPVLSRSSILEIETTQKGVGCSIIIKSPEFEKKIEYDFENNLVEELILGDYISPFEFLTKISVTIFPKNSTRQSHKISGYIWPSVECMLEENTLLFYDERVASEKPAFLDVIEDESDHIQIDSTGISLDHRQSFRRAIICIKTKVSKERFIWKNTHDYMVLVDETGEEKLLDIGSSLLLPSDVYDAHLILFCNTKEAKLNIGGRLEQHPFKSSNKYIVRLGEFLSDAQNDQISLFRHDMSFKWLQIKRATKPEVFKVTKHGPRLNVSIKLNIACENIILNGETISGQSSTIIIPLKHVQAPDKIPAWINNVDINEDGKLVKIDINCSKYKGELTLYGFGVQISGTEPIQPFLGENNKNYKICLFDHHEPDLLKENSAEYISQLLFWINSNYHRQSRQHIHSELKPLLNEKCRSLSVRVAGASKLLACEHSLKSLESESSDGAYSILPVYPELYSGEPYTFSRILYDKSDTKNIGFYKIYEMRNDRLKKLFSERNLSVAFLSGYKNFIRSNKTGESLSGFDFVRYLSSANEEADAIIRLKPNILKHWNSDIKVLSGVHYFYALKKFEQRFSESKFFQDDDAGPSNLNLSKIRVYIERLHVDVFPWPDNQHSLYTEFLQYCVKLFSAFAKASRYQKASEFTLQLSQVSGLQQTEVLAAIARCIKIGPELFSFYLLLHEMTKRHP